MLNYNVEERNAVLAAIIEFSEDAIISKDLSGIVKSWNKAAEKMFGYSDKEMIGQHISKLIPPDRQSEEDMIISELRNGRRIEHYETVRITKDGKPIYVSITVSPIKNGDNTVTGASKIARDVTKQKEAELAQLRYARQLEAINETSKVIASQINEEDILKRVADDTALLCGADSGLFIYKKEDGKGNTTMLYAISGAISDTDFVPGAETIPYFEDTFRGIVSRIEDISNEYPNSQFTFYHTKSPGAGCIVSYLAIPVIAPGGSVLGGIFLSHRDTAAFTNEQEKLVQAIAGVAAVALEKARLYHEIKILNAKKDEFISFASHELKTPLTTIRGFLQLINKAPDLILTVIPKINKQVDRLSAIIGDLLDISKIESGSLGIEFSYISLHSLVRDCLETARISWPLHVFRSKLPAEDIRIYADGLKMMQVIMNLLGNAAKFSPETSVIVLNAETIEQRLIVTVTDHGIGILPGHLQNIFGRYFRVTSANDKKTDGLGLGLFISKEIILAHKGRIWAESELGKGSSFHIELPILSNTPE